MQYDIGEIPNLYAGFRGNAESAPDTVCYSQSTLSTPLQPATSERSFVGRRYCEVLERVDRVAGYLREIGVQRGDCVAIVSNTRPEWVEANLAIHAAGGIDVPVHAVLNPQQIGSILERSGAEVIFVENREQLQKLRSLPNISPRHVISFEEIRGQAGIQTFNSIVNDATIPLLSARDRAPQGRGHLSSINFTSGSSGVPKGVLQTHGNHLSNIQQAAESGIFPMNGKVFLFLPLAHAFARLVGWVGFLTPAELRFPAITDRGVSKRNQDSVVEDMRWADAHVIPVVPKVVQGLIAKVYSRAGLLRSGGQDSHQVAGGTNGSVSQLSGPRRALLAQFLRCVDTLQNAEAGFAGLVGARALWRVLKPLVSRGIVRQAFGRSFSHLIVGGAAFPSGDAETLRLWGVKACQGYGATELCVATHVQRPSACGASNVGTPLAKSIEVKLVRDPSSGVDEVWVRGPNVARGYHGDPELSAAKFIAEGDSSYPWYRTGDQGAIDPRTGELTIKGRIDGLLKLSNGEFVNPEEIETRILGSTSLIAQALVVGQGRDHCAALIFPDEHVLRSRLGEFAEGRSFAELCADNLVRQQFERILDDVDSGARVSFHHIRGAFRLIPQELSVENGLLTPTLKLARGAVSKKFADQISELCL